MTSIWETAADFLDPHDGDGMWVPWPKQQIATELAQEADELLFGGAAGPGKTEWGMEYVIDQMELYPGNRGGIFRRLYPSLEKTIIPRLKLKLHGRAKWNGQQHTFTFPNDSILELASLQYADTVLEFQGAEYGIIFFEEITEFLQSQWEYLIGRLRVPATAPVPRLEDGDVDHARMIKPHAIATTNPGGRGHVWVKRRFVKPKPDDVDPGLEVLPMRTWSPRATDEDPEPNTRVFVPATHEDNPALLEKDPTYLNRLRQISDRGLRLAMEKGDWDAIEQVTGALWNAGELDIGRISPERFKLKVRTHLRAVSVDPSDGDEGGDAFGVSVAARGMDGVAYVEYSESWRSSVRTMAKQAIALYHNVGADALVIERNHGGKWMLEVFRTVDPYVNIVDVWASDGKRTRARPVSNLFEPDLEDIQMPFKARLVGHHEELEEQMTTTDFDDPKIASPDALDAMVWNLSWLMFGAGVAHSEGEAVDNRLAGRR